MDRSIDDYDRAGFRRKMSEMNPRAIAFTSKKAASVWLGCKTSEILAGQQPDRDLGATIFAPPSPSGAAGGHWDLGPWQAMADWVKADRLLNPSRYRSSRRTSAAPAASAASLA